MQTEKNEMQTDEIRAIRSNDETLNSIQPTGKYSPFCRTDCVVCNCYALKEIHDLRPTLTLVQLSERLKNDYELEISKDQLWRHFKNFNQKLTGEITKHIENFDLQVETLSEHQSRVLFLGKIAYTQIIDRVNSGTLIFTLDDFEKIMKLFYNTMKDPSAAVNDSQAMIALFQQAANRGGAPMEQMTLINIPRRTTEE